MAKFAWHGRERLGLLRVRDDVIVLHTMMWNDEVRDPSSLVPDPVDVSGDEVEEAMLLIDRMTLEDRPRTGRRACTGVAYSLDRSAALSHCVVAQRAGEGRNQPSQRLRSPARPVSQLYVLTVTLPAGRYRGR
ncbi:hypothetical protein ACFWWT_46265 [Streptomyces sp. NPDC058676]|uniref:hypothetical protein n=1 Tax=Streptomyces sp. NPDC058676 TaxID=3346593 RepID=UPI0036690A90